MNVWIALLHGVNVGGHNKLPMAGRNLRSCHKFLELVQSI